MDIVFSTPSMPKRGTIVVGLADHLKFSSKTEELDTKTGGALKRAMKAKGFKGKQGEILTLFAPAGIKLDAVILVGLGKEKDLDALKAQQIGGKLYAALNAERVKEATLFVEDANTKLSLASLAANIAYGVTLRSYRFDKYRTREKDEKKPSLDGFSLLLKSAKDAETEYKSLKKVADGVFLARDVVSEPPNVLYPESYAHRIKEELTALGAEVEILGHAKMAQLNMGALLGVGQGSARESKLVVIKWNGGKKSSKKEAPLAFVGKGVTFDTGGISIKPSAGMEDMKYDMGGSAAVVGLMKALAGRKAKVNVVGVVGLVENMPDGNAQRPSDIVNTMSGQTVEVLNTDAEGRLVLADALWYCQDRFNPQFMINLATLTGAIVIALGEGLYAGLFSNNDELCKKLSKCGEEVGERVWRFPLGEEYDRMIDSKVADMQNISAGRGAGSITAAQFLQRFVNGTPWAHLDIAGTAWMKKDTPLSPEGATAFGVRLLNRLVEEYEK